jgi:hypothetical protein
MSAEGSMFECACYCDYDYDNPEPFSSDMVRARVEHTCVECKETIPKGAIYRRDKGCWEGKWSQFDTCRRCAAIRDDHCDCWIYGSLWQRLEEAYRIREGAKFVYPDWLR